MNIRAQVLSQSPLCAKCAESGKITAATEVDHIVAMSNKGTDDHSNLQALCAECHKIKTRADRGQRERRAVGVDGYPK